jgi:trehalose utilization protein
VADFFFSAGLATQLAEIKDRGVIAIRTDEVAREHGLNQRQAEILDLLVAQGRQSMERIADHLPKVNRRTIQLDIKIIIGAGLVREVSTLVPPIPTACMRL